MSMVSPSSMSAGKLLFAGSPTSASGRATQAANTNNASNASSANSANSSSNASKDDSFDAAMSRAADAQALARARANASANAPKDGAASKTADAATGTDGKTPAGPDDAQWLAQFAAMMGHTNPGFPGPAAQAAAQAAASSSAQAAAQAALQGGIPGQTAILTATGPTALVGTDGKPVVAASTAADGLTALTPQAPVDTDFLGQVTNLLSGGQGRRADGVTASPTGAWSDAGDIASGVAKGAATALMRGADILPGFAAVAAAASAAADVANAAASAVAAASSALSGGSAAGEDKTVLPGAESSAASSVAATAEGAASPLPTHGITAHGVPTLARTDAPTIPGAPTPLNGQALQDRLDDALRWMAGNGLQNAELRVTPDALGPISIHVRLDGDTASVMFGSAHEQTRQALEASLAGLRDALAAAGMTLGDASVGSEQQQRQMMTDSGNAGRRQNDPDATPSDVAAVSGSSAAAAASQASTATVPPRRGNGLLNVYA